MGLGVFSGPPGLVLIGLCLQVSEQFHSLAHRHCRPLLVVEQGRTTIKAKLGELARGFMNFEPEDVGPGVIALAKPASHLL